MSRVRKSPERQPIPPRLTPEESAELRREAQEQIDRARRDGVYERLLRWQGKIKFPPEDRVRKDRG
jgi:hypothetical protein